MRGRPKNKRFIRFFPEITYFKPAGIPLKQLLEISLTLDEIESIRLAELNDLDQKDAAKEMKISRITFQRILHQAHRKIAEALIFGQALKIGEGDIVTTNLSRDKQIWDQHISSNQVLGGLEFCICPQCKKEVIHKKGLFCIQQKCPDCKRFMRGKFYK